MSSINIIDEQIISDIIRIVDAAKNDREWDALNEKQKGQWIKSFYLKNE